MAHGRAALAALVRRGLDADTPMAQLIREREQGYLADLGGMDATSAMERSLCRRLAILDLDMALLTARLHTPDGDRARRLSWTKLLAVTHARSENTRTFSQVAARLGIRRREKDVTGLDALLAEAAADSDGEPR